MNILLTLKALSAALIENRQTGSTSFLRNVGRYGGTIICADANQAKRVASFSVLNSNSTHPTISIQDSKALFLLARRPVPFVVDNYTIIELCRLTIARIESDKKEIKTLNSQFTVLRSDYESRLQKVSEDLDILYWKVLPRKENDIKNLRRQVEILQTRLAQKQIRTIRINRPRKVR